MIILVDIGNTYIKVSTSLDYSIIDKTKTREIKDFSSIKLPIFKDLDGVIISSVSKGKEHIYYEYFKEKYGIKPYIVSHDSKTKVVYNLKTEENELGSDLIALMEGASLKSNSFIIISLGTATVFNVVKDLKYIGTAISPGILTSLNGLIDSASLIENTSLDGDYDLLGRNTEEALRSGLFNGYTFLIEGFIKEIKNKYFDEDIPIYIFGGFSNIIKNKLKEKVILDDAILSKGLMNIYKLNR